MYLTISQVSNIYKVHENTIRNLIEKGEIKALKIGKQYRIDDTDLPQKESDIVNQKIKIAESALQAAGYTTKEAEQIILIIKEVL